MWLYLMWNYLGILFDIFAVFMGVMCILMVIGMIANCVMEK